MTPRQIAEGIVEREEDEARNALHIDRIADPAIFDRSRGDSVADQMMPQNGLKGVIFSKGDNTRIAGLMQIHERLRFREDGRPMMYIFESCRDWIRTVPNLPYSLKKPEDVDTAAEDHDYDATRYFAMSRPLVATPHKKITHNEYSPFER